MGVYENVENQLIQISQQVPMSSNGAENISSVDTDIFLHRREKVVSA